PLGAAGAEGPLQLPQVVRPAGAGVQPRAGPLPGVDQGVVGRCVARRYVHRHPPWVAVRISTRSPAASRVAAHDARGTTSPLTATATPRPEPSPTRSATRSASAVPSGRSRGCPLTTITTPPPPPWRRRTGTARTAPSPPASHPRRPARPPRPR